MLGFIDSLFRQLLGQLATGDVVVADRYYCSYFLVALLQARGIDVVFRLHQRRKYDFHAGQRFSREPERPARRRRAAEAAVDGDSESARAGQGRGRGV